jgi:LacI family transcriptional regulator
LNGKKVTIRDVARAAGTSASTVSRILNGSAPVSEDKRIAVEAAIERLGYRPSLIARSLATKTTYSIGLLINDITNPFYSVVAKGVEEEANRQGYHLILCNTNEDPERELQYLQELRDKSVDGIIFGPSGNNVSAIKQLASQIPLVQIDRKLDGVGLPAVLVDNENGAYQAINLLIQKGHRAIGLLGWEMSLTTNIERIAGYRRAMREAGLEIKPGFLSTSHTYSTEGLEEYARKLLRSERRPTAIFALNNRFGVAALKVIRDMKLRIPDDIALIVFDDIEVFSLTDPDISAVAQPSFAIGRRAVKLLIERIETEQNHLPETIVLPTHLIERGST